jgi:hypothetical protein
MKKTLSLALLSACLSQAATIEASLTTFVETGPYEYDIQEQTATGAAPSLNTSFGIPGVTATGTASGSTGFLRAGGSISMPNGTDPLHLVYSRVISTGSIVFTGIGSDLTTSLNLVLDGSLFLDSNIGDAEVYMHVRLGTQSQQTRVRLRGNRIAPIHGGFLPAPTSGQSYALNNETLTTAPFTVPLNTPITFQLELLAEARQGFCYLQAICNVQSSFEHTLHLPLTGDVFNLETGYSAESADWGIAGNQFNPVPEPSTGLLAFAALAAGACWSRRK